jgi:hypothetical protein
MRAKDLVFGMQILLRPENEILRAYGAQNDKFGVGGRLPNRRAGFYTRPAFVEGIGQVLT